MTKPRMNLSLEAAVLICGGATMVLELTGSRIMAPYVGASIYVWTSLIGVVLAFMSLGYWLGGRMADRNPKPSTLAFVIFAAAVCVAVVSIVCDPILSALQSAVHETRVVSLVASVLLFGAPSALLGIVLPYAARLKIHGVEQSGKTVGNLYALSTMGSILGTFLAGFVLLAYFKNSTIFLVLCASLLLASLLVSRASTPLKLILCLTVMSAVYATDLWAGRMYGADFVDANTPYNRVWIYTIHTPNKAPIQVMQINNEISSARIPGTKGLASRYARYYRLCDHFVPGLKKALMLGGAGYSYPMDFLQAHPQATLDVVEIDPGVTKLARKYFGLEDNPRLQIYHEDARTFLNDNRTIYDAIFGDAFISSSVPFHLTTLEMMEKVRQSLSKNGVFMMNVIGSIEGDTGKFLRAEIATLKKIFPRVYALAVEDQKNGAKVQNWVVAALKGSAVPELRSGVVEWDGYLQRVWNGPIADAPLLLDEYAPVERYQAVLTPYVQVPENPISRFWMRLLGKRASEVK